MNDAGDLVAVGADGHVITFEYDGADWVESEDLVSPVPGNFFGVYVALDGAGRKMITSDGDVVSGVLRAYIFER